MLNPTRMLAVTLRYLYLLKGSTTRVISLFIWILIDIVLWGFITRYLNHFTGNGFNFMPTLLGAVLLWDFLVRVMQGVTMTFFEDVWSRNFLNIFASPLTVTEYVGGMVTASIITSMLGLIAMLVVAGTIFGLSFTLYGVMLFPFLLILFLFGTTLGVVGCGMVLRFGPSAEWFVWPIPALISPFVGVFYPLDTLPHWMATIGHALPVSHVFEALRAIAAGDAVKPDSLILGFGLAVVYLALAGWWFTRVYKHAVRTGLIARYSAESTN